MFPILAICHKYNRNLCYVEIIDIKSRISNFQHYYCIFWPVYHMAPRSWRPDSSLWVTVPLSEVQPVPSEELIMSWSYSNQISGQPISVRSSPIVQGRDGGSRYGADNVTGFIFYPVLQSKINIYHPSDDKLCFKQ